MGKVLKTALVVGAVFAIVVATGGIAAPGGIAGFIGGATVTAGGVAAGAGIGLTATAAAFIGGAVIGAGLGVLSSMITPKIPKTNNETSLRLSKTLNPEEFCKIVFGETAMATDMRYWEVYGTDNNSYGEVIAAACHEVESFGDFYLEEELLAFDGSGFNTGGPFGGNLRKREFVVGSGAVGAAFGNKWDPIGAAATKMTGIAYYQLEYIFDQEVWPRGFPSRITQVGKGALVYDPRLDTTRGGSGAHRADDQTTWQYNDGTTDIGRNPVLQTLWYLLGWEVLGVRRAGMGVDPDDIDFASFITAANDAESEGYLSDIALSTGDPDETNISAIEGTCEGNLIDTGGRYSYHVGTDDTGTVAVAFDKSDIIGEVTWIPKVPMNEQYNSVEGQFVDPATLYQLRSYPKITDAAYVTADGFERTIDATYIGVQDNARVQKLVRLLLNRTRFQGLLQATFTFKALLAKNWDIVTVSVPVLNMTDKKFRVIRQIITSNGAIVLSMREEDAAIYASSSVIPLASPATGDAFDPKAKVAVAGDTVTAIEVSGDGISSADAIQVDWTTPSSVVLRTDVQYKRAADSDWISLAPLTQAENQAIITPLDANTSYDVRVRHVTILDVLGDWSVPTGSPVTTGNFTTLEVGGTDADGAHRNTLTYGVFDRDVTTFVEVPDAAPFDISAGVNRTFIIDVYFDEFDADRQAFWHKRDTGGTNTGWEMRIAGTTDKMQFVIDDPVGGAQSFESDEALIIERWYQIAVTRTAAGLYKMQIDDDIQAGSISDNVDISNAEVMRFGLFGSVSEFKGRLRNAQVWNVVRTQSQITDNRFKSYPLGEANLQGYWLFDEGTGLTVHDLGLEGFNGIGEGNYAWGGPVGTGLPNVDIALTDFGHLATDRGMDQGNSVIRLIPFGVQYVEGRDTDAITYGTSYNTVPTVTFQNGGINFEGTTLSNTGEIQTIIQAISSSVSGFTIQADVLETVASLVGHIDGEGAGTETAWNDGNGPTNPDWQAGKEATAAAWNNTYKTKYDATVTPGEVNFIRLGFYTNINGGGWTLQSQAYRTSSISGGIGNMVVAGMSTTGPDGDLYGVDIIAFNNATLDDVIQTDYDTAGAPTSVPATPTGSEDIVFRVEGGVE